MSQLISVLNRPANAGTDFPQPIDPLFTGINSNEIFNDNPFGHYLLNLRVPDYLKLYDDLKHEEGSLELIFNPDNAGKTRRARTRSLGTIRESDGSSDEEVGDYNVGEKEIVATGPMIALKNFKFEG